MLSDSVNQNLQAKKRKVTSVERTQNLTAEDDGSFLSDSNCTAKRRITNAIDQNTKTISTDMKSKVKKLRLSLDLPKSQLPVLNFDTKFERNNYDFFVLRTSNDSNDDTAIEVSLSVDDVNAVAVPPSTNAEDPKVQQK